VSTRDWQHYYKAGLSACEQGKLGDAVGFFNKAILQGPDRWEGYYARAWAQGKLGTVASNEIEADLMQAMELGGPYAADAAALMGELKFSDNEYVDAFSYFLQSFGRCSTPMATERRLVEALSRALSSIEQEAASQHHTQVCERLKQILFSRVVPSVMQTALEAEILATESRIWQSLGDRKAAESALQRISSILPKHPALFDLASSDQAGGQGPPGATNEPNFASIGGRDQQGTFQFEMKRLFEQYFGAGDLESLRQRASMMKDDPLRLILMSGPSGCGKTYIVRAFAGEYRKRYKQPLQIVDVRLNEVFGRYVGESERALTRLFDQARRSQPSILFIDEVDALGGARDNAQDWKSTQTSHFLQEIDRIREHQAFVLIIGCTNRIWEVELALLRRFDRIISVEMPTTDVRREILLTKLNELPGGIRPLDADIELLARESHGLTAGDIANVMRRAKDMLPITPSDQNLPRMSGTQLEVALRDYGKPMHVRDWVRRAADGLRRAKFDDLADDLIAKYQPYTGISIAALQVGVTPATPTLIPDSAWEERPVSDFSFFEIFRRAQP
jgi:chromosomal replication initiation ATPase DnaA